MNRPSLPARLLVGLARAWQLSFSAVLPPSCRFQPSCSAYLITAVHLHGAARGLWLGLARIARCHPWGGHGFDPVPAPRSPEAERH
ncbi:membrane protein insertion efficiency factor YidD [Thermaurantiacus sp.]